MEDVSRAVTMDLKQAGNLLFQVGTTHREMGGSHFGLVTGAAGGEVPKVDLTRAPQLFQRMHRAISSGLVRACHDLSEGGLAVAVAEMAFAGGLGAQLDLRLLGAQSQIEEDAVLLFSESNTRFLIEVPAGQAAAVRELFAGLPLVELGAVCAEQRLTIRGMTGATVVDVGTEELRSAWKSPLAWN
jgi:phosphoribosylformylglycinamidine synthase